MNPPPSAGGEDTKPPERCSTDFISRSADYLASICAEHPDHPALAGVAPEEAGFIIWGLSNAYFMRWIARGPDATPLSQEAGKMVALFCRGCAGLPPLAKA